MIWILVGKYKDGMWEELDSATTLGEASRLLSEYKLAYGSGWTFDIKQKRGMQ